MLETLCFIFSTYLKPSKNRFHCAKLYNIFLVYNCINLTKESIYICKNIFNMRPKLNHVCASTTELNLYFFLFSLLAEKYIFKNFINATGKDTVAGVASTHSDTNLYRPKGAQPTR